MAVCMLLTLEAVLNRFAACRVTCLIYTQLMQVCLTMLLVEACGKSTSDGNCLLLKAPAGIMHPHLPHHIVTNSALEVAI